MKPLYHIEELDIQGPQVTCDIVLTWPHELYDGHFPGNPVVPGVLMLQMLKTAVAEYSGTKVRLRNAGNIKFPGIWDPRNMDTAQLEIQLSVEGDVLQIRKAHIRRDTTVFLKFKGTFDVV